ncbi:hypothetical protein DPMN_115861 [Dreissena polymorpha]|uniref:Uncharacterized protein n=1 Tax=Dreissena polymorpha TaxID=45954 RepID=A0A9D4KMR8_DREPO|nr:hypothetical protein DPMN_115861 [Dreissena polymorpha]
MVWPELRSVPNSSTYSDVGGIFSVASSMSTENDNITVIPNVTFSHIQTLAAYSTPPAA